MHLENLYKYRVNKRGEELIDVSISINEGHPIYRGHFPRKPITPGVCQILMIREILETERKIPLRMSFAKQIKFTAIHEPGVDPEIDATITFSQRDDILAVSAKLHKNEIVFLKFKGEFKEQK